LANYGEFLLNVKELAFVLNYGMLATIVK